MNLLKIILISLVSLSTLIATEIKFEAIEYFVPNSRVVISADIEDETGLAEARVYFKSIDSKLYPFVKMSCKAQKCKAILPMSDKETKTFNYIILFQNNIGEVFKTKIFTVSKRDMIELPSWQSFDNSPIEVKSELFLIPKEIIGFDDDFKITAVKDRKKYGVVAKIIDMKNAGIKKLDEIPNSSYGGEISESGIDRGIEDTLFTTKNMLIGGGVLAGLMALSSGGKKTTTSALTPEGIEPNSYDLSANLEAPIVAPTVNTNMEVATVEGVPSNVEVATQDEIPSAPSGTLVPNSSLIPNDTSDYELSTTLDTPLVEPSTSSLTATTNKSVDSSKLSTTYPTATLPTQTKKSATPPEPALSTEVATLPPTPTLTAEPTTTTENIITENTTTTDTSTPSLIPNQDVSILTTSDGSNTVTITTSVTTTITTAPTYESTTRDNFKNCNENIVSSGAYNENFKIALNTNAGTIQLTYNMFNSKDRVLIYYENSLIYESGCVSLDGSELNDYNKRSPKNISFNGEDTYLSVEVSGDCERSGQVDWNFLISCP